MSKKKIQKSIQEVEKKYKEDIKSLNTDDLHITYLGKKGILNKLFGEMKTLSAKDKVEISKELNKIKSQIEKDILKLRKSEDTLEEVADLTIPVIPTKTGHLHPLTVITRELYDFFHYYGFSVYDGPEIEDDYHNFEMMGVPKDHPAREQQDTLYILEPEILLRTQTSSIEARELERQNPPIRFVFAGKAFRNETANKSNSAMFHQFQGVYVGRNVTLGNLKWIFTKSLQFILGENVKIRFRAKYYPEVEPGLSPDIQCTFCKGKGCDVCKNRGWIEIAGGGMIHPKTLEMAKIDPSEYSGFAFGWGLDRIVMSRYNIHDIRELYNGSITYS